jgi:hypothetical protein
LAVCWIAGWHGVEESAYLEMSLNQQLEAGAQRRVILAGTVQEGGALAGGALPQGLLEEFLFPIRILAHGSWRCRSISTLTMRRTPVKTITLDHSNQL